MTLKRMMMRMMYECSVEEQYKGYSYNPACSGHSPLHIPVPEVQCGVYAWAGGTQGFNAKETAPPDYKSNGEPAEARKSS